MVSDKTFEEIKQKAIKIWSEYDDEYGYATEKIKRVKEIKNIKDNYQYIINMFDYKNQEYLFSILSDEALRELQNEKV